MENTDTSQSVHGTSPVVTVNTYAYLKGRCDKLGIPIKRMVEVAGGNRSVIDRWKDEEPKSFKILRSMETALDKLENGEVPLKSEAHEE